MIVCSSCLIDLPRHHFSRNQLTGKSAYERRCTRCIFGDSSSSSSSSEEPEGTLCFGCGEYKFNNHFSRLALTLRDDQRRCHQCLQDRARRRQQEREREERIEQERLQREREQQRNAVTSFATAFAQPVRVGNAVARQNRRGPRRIRTHGSAPPTQRLQYAIPLDSYDMPPSIKHTLPSCKRDAVNSVLRRDTDAPCRTLLLQAGATLVSATEQLLTASELHKGSRALEVDDQRSAATTTRARLHAQLWVEEARCITDLLSFAQDNVQIRADQHHPNMYVVPAEGVSEKRPSVLRGDTIECAVTGAGNDEYDCGYVHFVHLNELVVSFSPDSCVARLHDRGCKFDVVYSDNNRVQWRQMHRAVDSACLLTAASGANFRPPPMFVDCTQQQLNVEARPPKPLNHEQHAFVAAVCSQTAGIHLLHGPPGTGKTTTCVAAIARLTVQSSAARILVVCPSNAASDLIIERLAEYQLFKSTSTVRRSMLRVHALSRATSETTAEVCRYSHVNSYGTSFIFPAHIGLLRPFHIVVSTMSTAGKIFGIGAVPGRDFTHIFVDEAGQATEQQMMLATTLLGRNGNAAIILAGDHKQLGPVIHSGLCKEAGMGVSPLERLAYTLPPRQVTLLRENYRSHPSILRIVNIPYADKLVASRPPPPPGRFMTPVGGVLSRGPPAVVVPRNWKDPLLFCHVEGNEERVDNSPSWKNEAEVSVVVGLVKQLINDYGENPEDIVVLTPYLLQRETIDKRLFGQIFMSNEIRLPPAIRAKYEGGAGVSTRKRNPVKVCTIEAFQGKESKIVIVSVVRSRGTHVGDDVRHHLGFMAQPQRSNVALSRAMDLLVVVGNAKLLMTDCLRENVAHAEQHRQRSAAPGGCAVPPVAKGWNAVLERFREMNAIVNLTHPAEPINELFAQAYAMSHRGALHHVIATSAAQEASEQQQAERSGVAAPMNVEVAPIEEMQ